MEGRYRMPKKNKHFGVHMSHCNQGEYIGSCCYGEPKDCPAIGSALSIHKSVIELETKEHREVMAAIDRLADKCYNAQSYEGDSTIGRDVEIIKEFIREI